MIAIELVIKDSTPANITILVIVGYPVLCLESIHILVSIILHKTSSAVLIHLGSAMAWHG